MRKLKLQELNRVSPKEFKSQEKTPFVIVLDNIRSGLNVGSAFRTGDAFALQHIYLCGITAQPPHREILKTAIGATESMDWSYRDNTVQAVQELRDAGYQIWAVEQTTDSTALQNMSLSADARIALVFGNEVNGVGEEVIELVDGCIEIPQYGTKHSLNISVCIGLVVWDLLKKTNYIR